MILQEEFNPALKRAFFRTGFRPTEEIRKDRESQMSTNGTNGANGKREEASRTETIGPMIRAGRASRVLTLTRMLFGFAGLDPDRVQRWARLGAERLWNLMHTDAYVPALGAITGNQAIEMVQAGLKSDFTERLAGGSRWQYCRRRLSRPEPLSLRFQRRIW